MADIYGTTGPDTIYGGEEDDSIFGWAADGDASSPSGDDKLYGMRGDDTLYGGDGNDTLDGVTTGGYFGEYSGKDTLIGGIGDDIYIVDGYQDSIVENFNEGIDTVITPSASGFTLGDNLENLTLTYAYRYRVTLYGIGNDLDNTIIGGAYENYLYGNAGNDTLISRSDVGRQILYGGAGNDTLKTEATSGSIYGSGETGDDTLLGGNSSDYLYGGEGNDYLDGNNGNDQLYGQEGSDTLTGGAGADTFNFFSLSQGIDTITDFASLQGDKIWVDASGFGIEQGEYDKFTLDSSTGALFFDQKQFASLQPSVDFVPSRDITIS